jgi:hypothetical protein
MRALLLGLVMVLAVTRANAVSVQETFNHKYRDFLSQNSQALLPLPQLSKVEWKTIGETRQLQQIYSEPERFYNSKAYTFTMYRDEQSGAYYLEAKGGFWGMEELIYGPLNSTEWE